MYRLKVPALDSVINHDFTTRKRKGRNTQLGARHPFQMLLIQLIVLAPLIAGVTDTVAETATSAPNTVTGLIAPSGAIAAETAPSFNWLAVTNSAHYRVFVVDVISGTPKTSSAWLSAASLTCASGGVCSYSPSLIYSGLVKWRVQARNSAGKSAWSDAEFFYAEVPPPEQIETNSPDGTIATNLPEYQWESDILADQYRLAVVDSDSGLQIINQLYSASEAACPENTGTCSVTPSIPVSGNLRWWIQPRNAAGKAPWSARRNFNAPSLPQ